MLNQSQRDEITKLGGGGLLMSDEARQEWDTTMENRRANTPDVTPELLAAMEEEVRNECAKACSRDNSRSEIADKIKWSVYENVSRFQKGIITFDAFREIYQKALCDLNEIRYDVYA